MAQAHERQFWEYQARGIARGDVETPSWYGTRADNLSRLVGVVTGLDPTNPFGTRVVEVGSGPVGMVAYLDAPERFAVDPLNDHYAEAKEFSKFRDPGVRYITGRGESLPFDAASVDTLLCENVLDHVESPDLVLAEFARVLKPQGLLFLRVEVFGPLGSAIHTFLALTRLDPLHPHTFTPGKVLATLKAHGFAVLHEELGSYADSRNKGLASPVRRARVLARIGMNAVIHTALVRNGA